MEFVPVESVLTLEIMIVGFCVCKLLVVFFEEFFGLFADFITSTGDT